MVFRRGCFSHPLSLLTSAFALLISPACFSTHLRRLTERSPTTRIKYASAQKYLEFTLPFNARTTRCTLCYPRNPTQIPTLAVRSNFVGAHSLSFNFDQEISREHTNSVKYDGRQGYFGTSDVIPLWVADMDFASPEVVTQR